MEKGSLATTLRRARASHTAKWAEHLRQQPVHADTKYDHGNAKTDPVEDPHRYRFLTSSEQFLERRCAVEAPRDGNDREQRTERLHPRSKCEIPRNENRVVYARRNCQNETGSRHDPYRTRAREASIVGQSGDEYFHRTDVRQIAGAEEADEEERAEQPTCGHRREHARQRIKDESRPRCRLQAEREHRRNHGETGDERRSRISDHCPDRGTRQWLVRVQIRAVYHHEGAAERQREDGMADRSGHYVRGEIG